MNLSTQPYKGARDFYPEDKRLQKHIFEILRKTVQSFGYEEYDAPILEPLELYVSKTSEEIVNEQTFAFTDRGGRNVTLRPEMTPSVSRMVAGRRQELSYPLRWYSIPSLWRYERPQKGRLREHYQLNVDLFGEEGIEADHEIILIADSTLKAFGASQHMYKIRLSSRKLINYILNDIFSLDIELSAKIIRLVDKKDKMPAQDFTANLDVLLTAQQLTGLKDQILGIFEARQISDLPEHAQSHESAKKLIGVFEALKSSGVDNAVFDICLVRGFDYYTDIVFEVVDTNPENNRSMFGGGRYDGLVAQFGVEPVPTVGFGMGDVTLIDFLQTHQLLPEVKNPVDARVVLIDDVYEPAQDLLAKLRATGLNLAVDSTSRKIDSKIKAAAKSGVRYIIFLGQAELESGQLKIKDLSSAQEQTCDLEQIYKILHSA